VFTAVVQTVSPRLTVLRPLVVEGTAQLGDKYGEFGWIHLCTGLFSKVLCIWGQMDQSPFIEAFHIPQN
jgi:hypothetical protein